MNNNNDMNNMNNECNIMNVILDNVLIWLMYMIYY